jgi:hypothetical protein
MVEMAEQTATNVKAIRGLAIWLIVFLVIGATIAWFTSIVALTRFYASEGTLLRFDNFGVKNPMITPCFWGALAYLVCLGWGGYLYSRVAQGGSAAGYRPLGIFLIACVLFGFGNVGYEWWQITHSTSGSIIGCLAQPMTSVFQSPCMYGSIMFLVSMIAAFGIARKSTPA